MFGPFRPAILVAVLLAAGCSETPTQLVVAVDSDINLSRLSVRVSDADTRQPIDTQDIDLSRLSLPQSFGVLPPGGDDSRRVRIELTGLAGESVEADYLAISPFLPGKIALLEIFLSRACGKVTCEENETCSAGMCRSAQVDPGELVEIKPGDEIRDGGPPPAGDLLVEPARVDFNESEQNPRRPQVFAGQLVTATVEIRNATTQEIEGLVARSAEPQFSVVTPPPETLGPNATAKLVLRYEPTAAGTHTGTLVLESFAADATVALTGVATACENGQLATPDGQCPLVCPTGFGDADGDPSNGCECSIKSPVDDPDLNFEDANCDGIDGDLTKAIFVSPTGSDNNPGTQLLPLATVQEGLLRAASGNKDVYVALGTYQGPLSVARGVRVFGGYNGNNWRERTAARPVVSGGNPGITVENVAEPVHLELLEVVGGDATTAGEPAIGLSARFVDALRLVSVVVSAGRGADGAPGAASMPGAPGAAGNPGQDGCPDCTGMGNPGTGGVGPCGNNGTEGGQGGVILGSAEPGDDAGNADGGYGGVGALNCPNCPDDGCNVFGIETMGENGGPGEPGASGAEGEPGIGDTNAMGMVVGGLWRAGSGGQGSPGEAGEGGAGGGGGGAGAPGCAFDDFGVCDFFKGGCSLDRGAGGGGGGSGGCPGPPGVGGGGGGASFALFAHRATVEVLAGSYTSASGGQGGLGGTGGAGGMGGLGGLGGLGGSTTGNFNAGFGGEGGQGGAGGAGGRGGGGAGGPSIVIYSSESMVATSSVTLVPGQGGPGGMGLGAMGSGVAGASLPLFEGP